MDRFIRQHQLIAPALKDATVVVVGLGMLGSWTAQALVRMTGEVHGYDHDEVGGENIGTQSYDMDNILEPKAEALRKRLHGLPFISHPYRFDGSESPVAEGLGVPSQLVVVSAVDSMSGRQMVAEWTQRHGDLFVDTRAHGSFGVVCLAEAWNMDDYLQTLERDEVVAAPACGMEGTSFIGLWVASKVAVLLNSYYLGFPVDSKLVENVALGDITVRTPLVRKEREPLVTA